MIENYCYFLYLLSEVNSNASSQALPNSHPFTIPTILPSEMRNGAIVAGEGSGRVGSVRTRPKNLPRIFSTPLLPHWGLV